MQKIKGIDALRIDIANQFGLDKVTWNERIAWVNSNETKLEEQIKQADKPILYQKAVTAYRKALKGEPIGHIMYLDATASGLQIMAVLTGCKNTALYTNLISPEKRYDLYQVVADRMNLRLKKENQVKRADVKKPTMTHQYGKLSQEEHFSEEQEEAFYSVIQNMFPGPSALLVALTQCWNSKTLQHTWVLPDRHRSYVPVTEMVTTKIEIDELDHTSLYYRYEKNMHSNRSTSLAPNVIHSIDGWITRQMIERCNFPIVPIHDSFGFHPNKFNEVRQTYLDILTDLHKSDILNQIFMQLGNNKPVVRKDLTAQLANAEYMLS